MQARAVVAYGCLFSGLRYICNTCTQVADRYITLILRKKIKSSGEETKKLLLQELINKLASITNVKTADYNQDYTQVLVILPDDTEYRVDL